MKLTIDVDDELMAKVMDITCADNEEQAVEISLMSMSGHLWFKKHFPEEVLEKLKRLAEDATNERAARRTAPPLVAA